VVKRVGKLRASLAFCVAAVGLILEKSLDFDEMLLWELQQLQQQQAASGALLVDYAAARVLHRRWQGLLGAVDVIEAAAAALYGANVFLIRKHALPCLGAEEARRQDEQAEETAASFALSSLAAAAGASKQQRQQPAQEQRPPLLSAVTRQDVKQRYVGFGEQDEQWQGCAVVATDAVLLLGRLWSLMTWAV
jgi:hypothetical protein